ncbi:MAG: hypothetical protein EOO77_11650, partial [Oxalobacteraceae bacterium]
MRGRPGIGTGGHAVGGSTGLWEAALLWGGKAGPPQRIGGDLLAAGAAAPIVDQVGCRRMSDDTAAVILALATENAELRAPGSPPPCRRSSFCNLPDPLWAPLHPQPAG